MKHYKIGFVLMFAVAILSAHVTASGAKPPGGEVTKSEFTKLTQTAASSLENSYLTNSNYDLFVTESKTFTHVKGYELQYTGTANRRPGVFAVLKHSTGCNKCNKGQELYSKTQVPEQEKEPPSIRAGGILT